MAASSSSGALKPLELPSATATYSVKKLPFFKPYARRHPLLLQFPTFSGKPSLLDTSGKAGLQRWRRGCGGQKRSGGGWMLEFNGELSFKENSNSQMVTTFRRCDVSVHPPIPVLGFLMMLVKSKTLIAKGVWVLLFLMMVVKKNKTLIWVLGIWTLLTFLRGRRRKATPTTE